MKIRSGFVSNSSTSSFCVFGVGFDSVSDVMKALGLEPQSINGCDHEFDRMIMRYCPECGEHALRQEDEEDLLERVAQVCESHGLEIEDYTHSGEGDSYPVLIGSYPSGSGQKAIDGMIAINRACLELFGKEATIHTGAYAN